MKWKIISLLWNSSSQILPLPRMRRNGGICTVATLRLLILSITFPQKKHFLNVQLSNYHLLLGRSHSRLQICILNGDNPLASVLTLEKGLFL